MKNVFNYLLVIFLFAGLFACEQNESNEPEQELLEPEYGVDVTLSGVVSEVENGRKRLIAIEGRLYRPRRACYSGFGICNVRVCALCRSNSQDGFVPLSFSIHSVENGRYEVDDQLYFELQLNDQLDEIFDSNFYIDEALEFDTYAFSNRRI